MKSKALSIFPTTVWMFELGENDVGCSNEALCTEINRLLGKRPVLQPGRSWQTDQTLYQIAFFDKLHHSVMQCFKEVLAQQAIKYSDIEFTGSWANISPGGSVHTPHMHPNNYLSAVYYPRAPKGGNHIVFHRSSREMISPPTKEINAYNAPEVAVSIESGSLVIFPSSLMHSVPANQSKTERVSIAFNVMFGDFARTIASPKWSGIALKT